MLTWRRIPVQEPYDAPGIFTFLADRVIDGVEHADLDQLRYARTVHLPHGPGAIEVTYTQGALETTLELANAADTPAAIGRVQRLFDAHRDPGDVDTHLESDPLLAPSVRATPGIRVPGAVNYEEMLVRALVGQQISVAAARKHLSRLAETAGAPYESKIAGLNRCFPTPEQIISAVGDPESLEPTRPLRLPRQSVKAVVASMRALLDGELNVHTDADPEELFTQLVARPRIGIWTANYVLMRLLGHPDVWPEGDVALVAGARKFGIVEGKQHKILARKAMDWAPWRSYAAMHIWRNAS